MKPRIRRAVAHLLAVCEQLVVAKRTLDKLVKSSQKPRHKPKGVARG